MKTTIKLFLVSGALLLGTILNAQEIRTLIGNNGIRSNGGYGALTNKITRIGGQYTNMSGIYAGWYINHRFTLGVSGSAVTNDLRVPDVYSAVAGERMSYEYGQCGLLTEYVLASHRVIHLGFQLFSGAGFTTQYQRYHWQDFEDNVKDDGGYDTHWFVVAEPGVNVEVNVFKWMRLCSGISYRKAFNSTGLGLKDADINGKSFNVSLKLGRF
jgi:hypothetical protein